MDTIAAPEAGRQDGTSIAVKWGTYVGLSCKSDGCGKSAKSKGFCYSHYNKDRWSRGVRPPSVNPTSHREAHLKHRYGIDRNDYHDLLKSQGGACAICKRADDLNAPAHWRGHLCVDHDHETGKVRGLLCNDCNLTIGYCKTEDVLLNAAAYVRLHARPDRIN